MYLPAARVKVMALVETSDAGLPTYGLVERVRQRSRALAKHTSVWEGEG